jgi:hypothetical protein
MQPLFRIPHSLALTIVSHPTRNGCFHLLEVDYGWHLLIHSGLSDTIFVAPSSRITRHTHCPYLHTPNAKSPPDSPYRTVRGQPTVTPQKSSFDFHGVFLHLFFSLLTDDFLKSCVADHGFGFTLSDISHGSLNISSPPLKINAYVFPWKHYSHSYDF